MQAQLTTVLNRIRSKPISNLNPQLRITHSLFSRRLSTSPTSLKRPSTELPPRPTLPDADLKHAYLKGSGPGGQKINKTSSAVQLTHLPTGIVVKSQATRSRSQNHTIARRILAEKIELLERGDESRAAKKIERARRKKASAGKKSRRKYRKLEDGDDDGDMRVASANGSGAIVRPAAMVDGTGAALARGLNDADIEFEEVDDEEWIEDSDEGSAAGPDHELIEHHHDETTPGQRIEQPPKS